MIVLITESSSDRKYFPIYRELGITAVTISPLKALVSRRRIDTIHLRYLKRHKPISLIYYLGVALLCRIRGIKLIWTIHNVREHRNLIFHNIIKEILYIGSTTLVVLEDVMIKHIPVKHRYKTITAPYFINNTSMRDKYLKRLGPVELIYVSTNKNPLVKEFYSNVLHTLEVCHLFVSPIVDIVTDNHKKKIPFVEFQGRLKVKNKCIGLLLLTNRSVATGFYHFITNGIPIISIRDEANSSLIEKNNIGIVIDAITDVPKSITYIENNYHELSFNAFKLSKRYRFDSVIKSNTVIFS